MYKMEKNKILSKLIVSLFAVNSVGGMLAPMVHATSIVDEETEKNKAELDKAQQYEKAVKKATSSVIDLKEDDDDLAFLNKVILLCSDSTGKTKAADNYAKLIESAKEAHDKAEKEGKEADNLTGKILWADDRIHSILDKLQDVGTIDTSVPTATMIDAAKGKYQTGIAEVKTCKAKAAVNGTDAGTCVLSPDAQAAANLLMTKGMRQMNITSTTNKSTDAADTKGASKKGNKDAKWVKDPETGKYYEETQDHRWVKDPKTGKYHEETTTTRKEITCPDGEVVNEAGDSCVKKEEPKKEEPKEEEPKKEEPKAPTCADGLILSEKEDSCIKKEDPPAVTPEITPPSSPEVTPAVTPAATPEATPQPAVEAKSGGGGGGNKDKIITALGTLGALAGMMGGHSGDTVKKPNLGSDNIQYAFNYMSQTQKEPQIHLLPSNSDSIKFKLFAYNIPKNENGENVTPQAMAFVQIPMQRPGGAPVLKEVRIPLKINQMVTLFPETITDSDKVYLPLKEFGAISRISAANFQGVKKDANGKTVANGKALPYYTMKVVVDDGISGHSRNFLVHYDFRDTKTVLANPDKELKSGTNTVVADALNLDFTGKIAGASWDNDQQSCIINLDGETMDNDSHEKYNGANQISSQRYNQAGCGKIDQMKGNSISLNGITKSNDGKGNEILVDDKAFGAQVSIDKSMLKETDISDDYKDDIAFEKQNVDLVVKRTDGTDQVFLSGYKTDGTYLYDTNGNRLTLSQEIGQAKIVNDLTGQNYYRIGACEADNDTKLIGQVCSFQLDSTGNEVQVERISGQNFTRKDLFASGNVNNADMEMSNKNREENNVGWSDVSLDTVASKIFDTVSGQVRVLDQPKEWKQVSINGISEKRVLGGYRDYEELPAMKQVNEDGSTRNIDTARDIADLLSKVYSSEEPVTINIGDKTINLDRKAPDYENKIQGINDYYNEMKIRASNKADSAISNGTKTIIATGSGVVVNNGENIQIVGDSPATYVKNKQSNSAE